VRFGVNLTDQQLDLFRIYLGELWSWNRKFNLTGLQDRGRIVIELFLDSLVPSPFLPGEGDLLDVGSGAGFPGLPLKIHCPLRNTFLLEPNSKKVGFLRHVIRLIRLEGIHTIRSRVEHLPKGGCYDMVTARALAEFGKTLECCSPLVNHGGLLVLYMGARAEEILKESGRLVADHHLKVVKTLSYVLPGKRSDRHTVIFRKEDGLSHCRPEGLPEARHKQDPG
jgi:16S rRNA (guanine527-N7)-methyltransferase